MRDRSLLGALLLIGLVVPLTSCTNSPSLTSITVTPAVMNFGGPGLTTQLTAIGSYTHPGHAAITKDITSQVTWSSSTPQCVTVSNPGGLITSQENVCANIPITASAPGFHGDVTGSMIVNVTQTGGGGGQNADLATLSIIPSSQAVASPGKTAQFIAIGTTASGATLNVTNLSIWSSSSPSVASVGVNTGLVTGLSQGSSTITAIYTNLDGTVSTGTATFTVAGGASEQFTAVTVIPDSESLSASGQTGQFIALGTSGATGLLEDVTNSPQIQWLSSIPTVASVGLTTGLAQGLSVGTTSVTAILTNPDQTVVTSSPATVTVSLTTAPEPLLSLVIVPASITVGNLQDTGQFLAIGTFSSSPYVRDLTNTVNWLSSEPNVFPVSTNNSNGGQGAEDAGVVSAFGTGGATIIAEATATDGSVQTATAQFNCPLTLPNPNGNPPTPGSCFPGSQAQALLSTLTVYNEGTNTTGWLVTAPSATNTPAVLHCGPGWALGGGAGGSVCTASYPAGTVVTITAPAETGVNFGGWSYNCAPTAAISAVGPNSCNVVLDSDDTVGAIFN